MNKHEEELFEIRKRLRCLESPTFVMCPHCNHYVTMVEGFWGNGEFIQIGEYYPFSNPVKTSRQCTVCGKIWEKGLREVKNA